MRRVRPGAGGTLHANRVNSTGSGSSIDPLSLIRSFDSESIPTLPVRPSPLSASTFQGLPLDLLDRLRSFPLFLSAPDSFLAAIGSHLRPQLHNPHDYILNEGDDAKAMYWLVRGALVVTSRDGESTYAELKPGAFFGEIGILMDIPRTATVVAKLKSLVVRLNKEDLQKVLPSYPEVERAIRDEALERLAILERKKKELGGANKPVTGGALLTTGATQLQLPTRVGGKRPRSMDGEVLMAEAGVLKHGEAVLVSSKKRKSPSPSLTESLASSALGSGSVNVRILLRELPLFTTLPAEILHFIGLNAQPMSYPPFTEIIKQGATGRDIFFIVRGEVEVVSEKQKPVHGFNGVPILMLPSANGSETSVIARLRPGQYFGEVTSLSLAPRRTATVRSISSVEALMISGDVLDELWEKCSPDLRKQVERTARDRLKTAYKPDSDVEMMDADNTPAIGQLELDDVRPLSPNTKGMFSLQEAMLRGDEPRNVESVDPDPYLNVDLENVRSRSRRGSLAPPSPSSATPSETSSIHLHSGESSPIKPTAGGVSNGIASVLASGSSFLSRFKFRIEPISPRKVLENKRARLLKQKSLLRSSIPSYGVANNLPENVIALILRDFDIHTLMKLRLVSTTWMKVCSNDELLLQTLDLTPFNKYVTDRIILDVIAPFAKSRPKMVDLSNCFHVTDEGFQILATTCADNVKVWKMKSVWDVTGQAVLDMTNKAKGLEEIDLSNCRKVGDNLLARVVGWVVPEMAGGVPSTGVRRASQVSTGTSTSTSSNGTATTTSTKNGVVATQQNTNNTNQTPAPGTIIGCPNLKRLTLSYCKHITDRSMAHIATHAAQRIEEMDLTRCTTITDAGFHSWSVWSFPRLTKLCLADCTYLTDNAVVWLTHAARGLKWLDLSFCCALSDIATEVLALGCPSLQHLNLAFCGSAVSDASLRVVARHLLDLRSLSVRGCVRVTGQGVEAIVEGCELLTDFDVSQCRNLTGWVEAGGREEIKRRTGRNIEFAVWAGEKGGWRPMDDVEIEGVGQGKTNGEVVSPGGFGRGFGSGLTPGGITKRISVGAGTIANAHIIAETVHSEKEENGGDMPMALDNSMDMPMASEGVSHEAIGEPGGSAPGSVTASETDTSASESGSDVGSDSMVM